MTGRKLRRRTIRKDPAIVVAAFGTTGRGKVAYGLLDGRLRREFPRLRISWAYTSEIIRERTGHAGLQEALAVLEREGYRKAVVQPLHVFPGTEYQVLLEVCEAFPGLRVVVGETLFHRWHFADEVLGVVSRDFLPPGEGINVLVAHGTPLAADPANILYLGLDSLLSDRYDNVYLSTIEGVPGKAGFMRRIDRIFGGGKAVGLKARLIPLMYVAGIHVEEDLLGKDGSYRTFLEGMGFETDCPLVEMGGESYPKGLGLHDETADCLVSRIERALELLRYY